MKHLILGALMSVLVATAGVNAVRAAAQAPGACASLAALRLPDTTIKSFEEVPGPSFTAPGSTAPIRNLPAFCRVVAVTKPAITVEVWMPLAAWNGKFQG